jgi:uncharacterized membrane protein YeaQ/YmgE (transglycosylase-associated protein family)
VEQQGLIGFLIVGLIAGWLAGKLFQGGGFGLFGNMIVGVIGALIGGSVFQFLGVDYGGFLGSLVTAVMGAGILLFVAGLFQRKA